jgi:hypothetical protein
MADNINNPGITWKATISAPNPKSMKMNRLVPSVSAAPAAIAGVAHAVMAPKVVIMRFMVFSFPCFLYIPFVLCTALIVP